MRPRRIVLNALTTFGQTLGTAATLFFLYRFLIHSLGIERLGIWSLALATTSVVWLANQGFSTSLVKFVAKYAAGEKPEDVSLLIQTAIIAIAVALGAVSIGLYPGARWLLRLVLPAKSLPEACAILPLAIVSLWLTVLEGLLQAALSGHELIAECNYLEMAGSLSYLLLAFVFVPRHGLVGLACAQVSQAAVILATTWFLLRRRVPKLPIVPRQWSRAHFRELAAYGFHFQVITASQALREPVTKALITKFGGLACTGLYDLAARAVITLRELIVQANQVLIPTIADLHERDPESIPVVYRDSYRLVFFFAVPAFASLAVASPLISRLWIGHYDPIFVDFVAILSLGWLVNVLANPSYVVALGTGALRWVSVGCISTVILNATLGFLAGHFATASGIGGVAVACASAFSLAVGYAIVLSAHHIERRVSFSQLLPEESTKILAASVVAALVLLPIVCSRASGMTVSGNVTTALLLTLVVIPVWLHPMRRRVLHWVLSRVPS